MFIYAFNFKVTADATDRGKLYSIFSTPELLERNCVMVLK